jgi:hypothetical protein
MGICFLPPPTARPDRETSNAASHRVCINRVALSMFTAIGCNGSQADVRRLDWQRRQPCSLALPCRVSMSRLNANPGGEVVALDSAGFGTVTISGAVAPASGVRRRSPRRLAERSALAPAPVTALFAASMAHHGDGHWHRGLFHGRSCYEVTTFRVMAAASRSWGPVIAVSRTRISPRERPRAGYSATSVRRFVLRIRACRYPVVADGAIAVDTVGTVRSRACSGPMLWTPMVCAPREATARRYRLRYRSR